MAKSLDYGTVSGQSTGFRGGPVRDGRLTPPAVHTVFRPMSSDEEFTTLQDRVLAAVKEINQQTNTLRQLYQHFDNETVEARIKMILQSTFEKVQGTRADFEQLIQIGQSSGNVGQRLAAKSLQQQLELSIKDFNAVSQRLLQEWLGLPRSQGSQSHGYLDSGEVDDGARLLHPPANSYRHTQQLVDIWQDNEEINKIMGEIAHMMVEQGERIDAIETQVESGYSNVRQGNVQLEWAVRPKKCSRCCICC